MRLLITMAIVASVAAADPASLRLNNDAPYRAAVDRLLAARPVTGAPAAACLVWHLRLANAYMALRRYDLAEKEARSALTLSPTAPTLHSNLSVMLGKQGRYAEALAEVDVALTLDPACLHAQLVRPSWELGTGRREAALAHFQAVPRPVDGDALALYFAAQACFNADIGDAGKVEEGIREALAHDAKGDSRDFFARDLVFDRYRAEPWFVDLVGATLDQSY